MSSQNNYVIGAIYLTQLEPSLLMLQMVSKILFIIIPAGKQQLYCDPPINFRQHPSDYIEV